MEFKVNRQGNLENITHRQCTQCGTMFERPTTTSVMTWCKSCNNTRVKANSLEYKMLARAKSRAKYRELPFNLELSDIVIPDYCPVLGIKLVATRGKSGAFVASPSLDRIKPDLGYIKGNIQVMSQLANQMKNNATPEQLLKFAEWVQLNY